MPSEKEGFKGISLRSELVTEIQDFIQEFPVYRSVAEFVSEATRVRMEQLRNKEPKRD